jgi:hypothetical protein
VALAKDGSGAWGGVPGTNVSSVSTNTSNGGTNQNLTTTSTDDVLVAYITYCVQGGQPAQSVSSVTDTAGLTWHKRGSFPNGFMSNVQWTTDIWWAHAPATLSGDIVTANFTGGGVIACAIINVIAISGADTSAPFDTSPTLPGVATNEQLNGTTNAGSAAPITTLNANCMLLAYGANAEAISSGTTVSSNGDSSAWSAGPFVADNANYTAAGGIWYDIVSSVQTNLPVGSNTDNNGNNGSNSTTWITDAVVEASPSPGSLSGPVIDGISCANWTGNTPSNPCQVYLTTQASDDILVLMIGHTDSNGISGVTDTAGLTWTHQTAADISVSGGTGYMEVWTAVTSAPLTNDAINVTFGGGGGVNGYSCLQVVAINNAETSPIFDTGGSPFKYAGGSGDLAISGVSTAAANTLMLLWEYAYQGGNSSYGSPFSTEYSGSGFSPAVIGSLCAGNTQTSVYTQNFTSTQSSDTYTGATSVSNTGIVAMAFAEAVPPPPNGPWASTETTDTLAFTGTVEPNTNAAWASVEVKDIMAFSEYGGLTAAWGSTEAKDAMHFYGAGQWASTDTKDTMAFLGTVTEPMGLDGYATNGLSNSGPYTSGTVTLSTTNANDVIVLLVSAGGFSNCALVTGVTDTAGLVWKKRNQRWQLGGSSQLDGVVNRGLDLEIWWAHAPTALSGDVITVDWAGDGVGGAALIAFGVSGANYTAPWDTHSQAGGYVEATGGFYFPPVAQLYTNASECFTFGFHGDTGEDLGVAQAPATYVTQVEGNEHDGYTSTASLFYEIINSPAINTNNLQYGYSYGGGTVYTASSVMFDSLVAAGETGTADGVVWFWDASSNNGTLVLSTSPFTIGYGTTNYNCMSLVQIMIQAAGGGAGAEVTSITESGSGTPFASSPGWERRSRVVEGNFAMEIWWAYIPIGNGKPSSVTLTINTSGTVSGDVVSASIINLGGTTGSYGLGDPFWDPNESLPAVNASTGDSPPPNVTDMSTETRSAMMVAWTANNTEPEPGYVEPYITLIQDYPDTVSPIMQFNSGAPAAYLGFEYYYTPILVSDESAEFLVSPEPTGWMMVGDAIPVGPPQPPIGQLEAVESKDTTHNAGSWEPLDGTEGWFGFVPLQCTFNTTDQPDQFTNDGDFHALGEGWYEGWIGYVPAHATMATTGNKDTLALSGWIIGFGGITGQIVATDHHDYLAFSEPTTVTGKLQATEHKDYWSMSGFVIPKAYPVPVAPKKRLLIVT